MSLPPLSREEKVAFLNGHGLWRSRAAGGMRALVMTDGAYGVRYSTSQIDDATQGLAAFLAVARGEEGMFGDTAQATCFPNANLSACAWDVDLAYRMGAALGAEARALGVDLLLGPGINIRRTPLAGRAFEYFSEDPVVSGELAAAMIRGLQDQGVGASLKHFACNNSEIDRTTTSSDVDPRALREIYLAGFERAIAKADPWTVMAAYNPLNGTLCAQNRWLLTTILREDWEYQGLVLSDWHAIRDRPAALLAGCDLDMPESAPRRAALLAAVEEGRVPDAALDAACERMARLIARAEAAAPGPPPDLAAHHGLARAIAAQSIVLLQNDGLLPLAPGSLLVIGDGAVNPVIQGSGSASTRPVQVDQPLAELQRHFRCSHLPFGPPEATLAAAALHDAVLVFASHQPGHEGEGADRDSLALAPGQSEVITALARAGHRVIVTLTCPDAVDLPWAGEVSAILCCFYPGQGGGAALADIIAGKVNPSGKLTTTFPLRMGDIPGILSYPGEGGRHAYGEGIFVGYRGYDRRELPVRFPFGHGLGYTTFRYDALTLSADVIAPGGDITARVTLTNTGSRHGAEVVQIYVRPVDPALQRPPRELRAFAKVALDPGESATLTFPLTARDFCHFDPAEGRFVLRGGGFVIEAAASSRDIRLSAPLGCVSEPAIAPPLRCDTPADRLLAHVPSARCVARALALCLPLSPEEADRLVVRCSTSFLGLYDTLTWYVGTDLSEASLQAALDRCAAAEG